MPSATDSDSDIALIARAVLRLARRLRVETPSQMFSAGALGLLATLHGSGPMSAVMLAAEEGLAPQSLTRLLQQLEGKAMIERSPDPDDGRARIIAITRHGRESLGRAMKERRKWLADAMADRLNEQERERLVEAAQLLLRLTISKESTMSEQSRFENRAMAGSVFRNCALTGASFLDIDLSGSTFSDVSLRDARLTNVNLAGMSIEDANIEGLTIFGHDIQALIRAEVKRTTAE